MKLANSHGHLTVHELLQNMVSLRNENNQFDLEAILRNESLKPDENLHIIMYLNDSEALKRFLSSKTSNEVLIESCKENSIGWNPLLIAVQFMSRECLLILLKFITKFAYGSKQEKKIFFDIMHCQGKSFLYYVLKSDYFNGELQLIAIECEGYLHDWKSSEFHRCLSKNIGTNDMSLKCQEFFSKKNIEEKGIGKFKLFGIYVVVTILTLYKTGSVSFDIGSDVTLLVKYGTSNGLINTNCSLNGSTSFDQRWTISSDYCFWITLVPVLLPILLNLIGVGSFIKRRKTPIHFILKICLFLSSPIWLVITAVMEALEELNKKTSIKKTKDEKEDKQLESNQAFADAKLIEVCFEASLQPILQLYLFLLPLVCSGFDSIAGSCITPWIIVQVLSFLSSILSIPRVFTAQYTSQKNGMMSKEAQFVYFLYVLLGAISRLMLFELMAFSLGPGNFPFVYAAIVVHVVVMIAVNVTFSNIENKEGQWEYSWSMIVWVQNQMIKGLSNIYIPWSNGKNEEKEVKSQLIKEIVFFLEYLGISIWGAMTLTSLPSNLMTNVVGAIWVSYLISVVFKITFFVSFHPWKEIIKNDVKTAITNWGTCCKTTPKKEAPLEIEMDGRPVVPGGAMAPDRSVNPISTKGGRLCPPNNTGTPGFSDIPTILDGVKGNLFLIQCTRNYFSKLLSTRN